MNINIKEKLSNIKLFVFDLDGVLIHNDEDSGKLIETVSKYSKEFKKRNLFLAVITARQKDELVEKLNEIENCYVAFGSIDKVSAAKLLLKKMNLDCESAFYVGDDILDIPLLSLCGLSAAPRTARREVKRVVDFILNGGNAGEIFKEILDYLDGNDEL
ncbi:HAD hydrolase family protein [Melioribacter sp. Ez-97]|uniref:HAD hydrolase family protein n=1 Tax=Melioribacter sp. Ez-97 TaxID=3423434 RepID=UPI003ED9B8B4